PVARANHERVARAPGESEAWRKHGLTGIDATVDRNVADTADEHSVVRVIVAFETAIRASGKRKILPAHAVRKTQAWSDIPSIPNVDAVQARAHGVLVGNQIHFADLRCHSEQERCIAIELIRTGAAAR